MPDQTSVESRTAAALVPLLDALVAERARRRCYVGRARLTALIRLLAAAVEVTHD